MSHTELITEGWKLVKLVSTPIGLIGIQDLGYRVYRRGDAEIRVYTTDMQGTTTVELE